ncbi:MAG: pentapeptide repeat-containing protein, partial [Tolypothrix sp. T3-bin4]|nr:pentapeptide repeat-containing protein [Tolypothrix sp. T3-bin4]
MNRPEYRIPEEKTQEVFTLAAQLYAQHNQSYSVKELMDAGAEAKIPPEFIQQAVEQIQLQQWQTQQ